MRKLIASVLLAFLAGAAHAATVTSVGDSFGIQLNGIVDYGSPSVATTMPGLTASAQLTVTGWSYDSAANETTVSFDILIDNTSDPAIWQSAVVTAIGFDTNPDALSGTASGVFSNFVMGGSFPTGAGFNVEYCASGNSQTCNGSGNTPLNVGQSGTLSVTMVFTGTLSTLDFSNFGIRWQALDSARLGIVGGSGIGIEGSTPPIPEPSALALFGLGVAGVGLALRRRASA